MPSGEISKNILQISACRAGINARGTDQIKQSWYLVTPGSARMVLRSAISVAIASRTAGRACMRSR